MVRNFDQGVLIFDMYWRLIIGETSESGKDLQENIPSQLETRPKNDHPIRVADFKPNH